MPRIRKRTSRRGTTNQREKIKHKVSETRRKQKKEAKKNPQWKSKHKKDPGIPNNFPYKDQILAEVAEQRRQAEEEKQRRKELKKAAKAAPEEKEDGSDGDGSDVGGYVGATAVNGTAVAAGSSKQAEARAAEVTEDEEPALINKDLPTLQSVLDSADVVVEVLDARDPLAYHSSHLTELVKAKDGQKLVLVLNKIDTCPREAVTAWLTALRKDHTTVLFRSASAFLPSIDSLPVKGKGKERADDAFGVDSILSLLGQWAKEKAGSTPLTVAIVGFTNVGKSSFTNSLIRKAACPIYKLFSAQEGPTTTALAQETTLEIDGKTVRLIDTPGLSWLPLPDHSVEDVQAQRSRDILTRNKGRIDRLKDPEPVVHELVTRAHREDLMLFYNLPAFEEKNSQAFLAALARTNGLIKKGGVLDIAAASRIILRDWSTGKFPRYTIPTTSKDAAATSVFESDEKILSALPIRKDLRKASGVVKLNVSDIESRKIAVEASWLKSEDDEDSEGDENGSESGNIGDEEEEIDEDEDEDEEDEDEDEDDEQNEEDDEQVPASSKRKRGISKAIAAPARPAKKVAFSAEPKGTKQARRAAGALGTAPTKAKIDTVKSKPSKSKPLVAKSALKKTANSKPASKSVVSPAQQAVGENEAYDFKKFF